MYYMDFICNNGRFKHNGVEYRFSKVSENLPVFVVGIVE